MFGFGVNTNDNIGGAGSTTFSSFSAPDTTPVPFDFDPSLGVVGLGVVFGLNKWRKNRSNVVKK